MTERKKVIDFLKENVDWGAIERVASLVETCGDRLLLPQKGMSFEYAIAEHSNGKIIRVDKVGNDLYIPCLDVNIEVKSMINMFLPQVQKTKNIVMKNAHGAHTDQSKNSKTFDYVVLIQSSSNRKKYGHLSQFGVGLVDYESYVRNKQIKPAVIEASFPYEDIDFLIKPKHSTAKSVIKEQVFGLLSLRQMQNKMMRDLVTQCGGTHAVV